MLQNIHEIFFLDTIFTFIFVALLSLKRTIVYILDVKSVKIRNEKKCRFVKKTIVFNIKSVNKKRKDVDLRKYTQQNFDSIE